tara:strand:+ start:342 stop:584 length:243 start_codon:yes stop_codon:yes gene_type:complete
MSKEKVMTDEGELVDSIHISGGGYVEKERKEPSPRKSLAIDVDTYELLRDICGLERRSLINQLQQLIEQRHKELFDGDYR